MFFIDTVPLSTSAQQRELGRRLARRIAYQVASATIDNTPLDRTTLLRKLRLHQKRGSVGGAALDIALESLRSSTMPTLEVRA